LILFVGAALLLFVVPGPSVIYIVTRSITQGRTAGLVSVAGIHVGSLVHIAAALLGVTALLAASAMAFTVVKTAGGLYLVYLGIRTLSGRGENADGDLVMPGASYRRIFWQGVLVNVLNPKTALFFLAFLPQFLDPVQGNLTLQLAVLGVVFVIAGVISDSTYALLSGTLGNRMLQRRGWARGQRWVSGSIYLGLGALALGTGTRKT
jgi:threonine/homoserine/homoserine lactone efflux protein